MRQSFRSTCFYFAYASFHLSSFARCCFFFASLLLFRIVVVCWCYCCRAIATTSAKSHMESLKNRPNRRMLFISKRNEFHTEFETKKKKKWWKKHGIRNEKQRTDINYDNNNSRCHRVQVIVLKNIHFKPIGHLGSIWTAQPWSPK